MGKISRKEEIQFAQQGGELDLILMVSSVMNSNLTSVHESGTLFGRAFVKRGKHARHSTESHLFQSDEIWLPLTPLDLVIQVEQFPAAHADTQVF